MVVVLVVVKFYLLYFVYISPWQIFTIAEFYNAIWENTCNDDRSDYCSTLLKCILGDGCGCSVCDGGVCGGGSCYSGGDDSCSGVDFSQTGVLINQAAA